ncbi:MAG: hypothetical protein KDI79_07465 [Anaerolineae bacterium]|nr:hypothetical protein [Anaerolineae bacterium]
MQFATITLIVEILFYLVLCAGVAAQLRKAYHWHDRLQAPIVILNIFFILFVMLPTFRAVVFNPNSGGLSEVPTLVTAIHGVLGTIAQLLAIYCLLAGFKILPRKIGVLRYWMWATFVAWTATVMFGVGVYLVYYVNDSSAGGAAIVGPDGQVISEHAETIIEEIPATAETSDLVEEVVAEHAEEAVAEEVVVVPPAEGDDPAEVIVPTEELVAEHAEEPIIIDSPATEPAAAPTEELIAESDNALVDEHGEVVVEVPAPVDVAGPMIDEGRTEMDDLISEHAEVVIEVEEPEFTGQMGFVGWQQLTPANAGPGPRYEHAMEYSPVNNQIYLFGGRDGSQIYNDIWALDMNSLTWRKLAVNSPTAPPARFSTVMMVDQNAENLYIATGHTQGNQNLGDIWRLNLSTETWEDLTGAAGPGPQPRYGDPGGNLGNNLVLTHGFGTTRYNDTWRFNTGTDQWENITPPGQLPLQRCLFAATTAVGTSLIIHGGCATPFGDCYLDDTWVLDMPSNTWREVTSGVKPVGRQYHTIVPAVSSQGLVKVILFGGQDASQSARNDTWILDVASGAWTLVDPQGAPSPRYNHASVWIPGYGMVIYGGRNNNGPLSELWRGDL